MRSCRVRVKRACRSRIGPASGAAGTGAEGSGRAPAALTRCRRCGQGRPQAGDVRNTGRKSLVILAGVRPVRIHGIRRTISAMPEWWPIEVPHGEVPAFRWQEQHDDALTEAALTNGAADGAWHAERWAAVFEICFGNEHQRE